jgi:hypothetical protein
VPAGPQARPTLAGSVAQTSTIPATPYAEDPPNPAISRVAGPAGIPVRVKLPAAGSIETQQPCPTRGCTSRRMLCAACGITSPSAPSACSHRICRASGVSTGVCVRDPGTVGEGVLAPVGVTVGVASAEPVAKPSPR